MSSKLRPIAFWAAVGFGIAAGYCAWVLNDHRGYRVALDHAGGELPERLGAIAAAPTARDIVAGYRDFLAWDSLLVPLLLLVFVFVAWYARLRSPSSSAPKMLVAAAVVYALSDWAENWMLGSAAADVLAGRQPSWLAAAAVAEWAKWLSFSACVVLVILTLLRGLGHRLSWARVLFLDMPAMVDDVWRRLEFRFHRETDYDVERTALKPRPWWQKTPFWLFGAVTLFVAYGPTLDGLCSASPAAMEVAVWLPLAALLAWAVWIFIFRMGPAIDERVHKRFDWLKTQPRPDPLLGERASIASFLLNVGGLLLVAPAIAGAITLGLGVYKFGWCGGVTYSGYSLARLGLWVLALAAFAYASSRPMQIRTLLQVQALLVAAVAIGTWLLSPAGANEASGHPYVHVFLVIAPVVCVLLCLTPGIAERRVRRLHGKAAERFSGQLPEQELFAKAPEDPVLNLPRVMHALTHGFTDRLLQLLIPPALLALVAPADWLPTFTIGGLLLAVLLSTWGNMSTRWQHMVLDLQRWFLQGTAYFVSLFVIVLAGARLLGVDYVTTILNAAPLGVVFGMVLMAYALSWLVEYWINRVVAAEMLEVLGAKDGAVTMSYPVNPKRELKVDVQRDGRYLMIHSIGRFAVVGRMQSRSQEAFHSYDLLDVFRALAVDKDDASVAARQADLYFHSFNLVLVLLAAACWLAYAYGPRYTAPAAVVEAQAEVPPEKHFDLAERLLAPAGDSRPALVLAASGGGTRAALYTAHVLEGLHRLGAAGDIALMSGVSGGGVALAYFAANREALVRAGPNDKAWQDFRRHITDPFIEDVLEGSTELRVYRAGSVSMLLAESFKRRLAQRGGRWSLDVQGAGLILNTAISGHPAAESELLERTLNDADDGRAADCKERDRPYRLMGGGRLVFTNLKQTSKFPQRDNRVPDVRLPYVLVRDPAVPLEMAAALNANFPPAFPNARVLLRGSPGAVCPDRTFFVTDGGAQENLGLVSALYAVQSALDEIRRHCGKDAPNTHPWCKRTLRPIRFVIAEASAATFDYEEDRGISTALTAKERMTGGLTGALIERNQELYLASGVRAGAEKLDFHFLGLPLVFRARGGLGTHWMHAARVEMIDPRLRVIPAWYEPSRRARATVTVTRANLDKIWLALHDPAKPYCSSDYSYGDRHTDTVRRWICGSPGDSRGSRDLHIKNWADLRAALDPGALQPKRP